MPSDRRYLLYTILISRTAYTILPPPVRPIHYTNISRHAFDKGIRLTES